MKYALALILTLGIASPGIAAIEVLDLTTSGAAGLALDYNSGGGTLPYLFSDVTLTASASSTIGSPVVNATSDAMGVNLTDFGEPPEFVDRIESDYGEELFFTLSFGPSVSSLFLTELDLRYVGSASGGDAALVYLNGGLIATLETGVANFNGSQDIWSPSPISLSSGDVLSLRAQTDIGIQGMTFDVAAIPEPVSVLVWSVGIAACGCLRRKR